MANEKTLERRLREEIRKAGGLSVKFTPMGIVGMPDRIILMPGGRVAFAEIKTPGKKPTPIQLSRIKLLTNLGFIAAVIDSLESLQEFIKGVTDNGIYTA
jgi:hypothetical protein